MKSDMYIKWDIYARQNDNNFKRYCFRHIGYGFEVFFTVAILLKMNDGDAIAKSELIESIQAETLIDDVRVSSCIDSLIELNLLKEEGGKLYSERVRRDIEASKELSEVKAKAGSKGGKAKANNKRNLSTGIANANQMPSTTLADSKQILARQLDNKTISQLDKNKENIKEKSSKFVKPTLEEVKAYCEERNNQIDPEAFIAYYESNGWHVGRDKMHSWKSAVITWEKRDKNKIASLPINKRPQVGYRPEDYKDVPETGIF